MGEDCRLMLETKRCSLFVAPAVVQNPDMMFGTNKVGTSFDATEARTGRRAIAGISLFCDPPNPEIVEQFRPIERATARRMVAVHTIRFPEDEVLTAE